MAHLSGNPPATPIEVRSETGRLLFRTSADGRLVEIVQRRQRYLVEMQQVGAQTLVVVCAVVEEEETIQSAETC